MPSIIATDSLIFDRDLFSSAMISDAQGTSSAWSLVISLKDGRTIVEPRASKDDAKQRLAEIADAINIADGRFSESSSYASARR